METTFLEIWREREIQRQLQAAVPNPDRSTPYRSFNDSIRYNRGHNFTQVVLLVVIKSLQSSPQYYHPPPPPASTRAYASSPPHDRKQMNMSTSSHFSSHLIDNQHERHDVIDRNAYSGHVNAPVLKRFETGFEAGLKLAM